MLTYQLRQRVVRFFSTSPPAFPADATLHLKLLPEVPFGGVAGPTRNMVRDTAVKARANLSTGHFYVLAETPLFDPLHASARVSDTEFLVRGNVATVKTRCASVNELSEMLVSLYFAFPAVLNVYFPDAPYSAHAWGTVGDIKFRWEFDPDGVRGSTQITSKDYQEQLVVNAWDQVQRTAQSRRLTGALMYFQTACRLLSTGQNRFDFVAESLLNMSKCLQALFGETRDDVRRELAKLGYRETDIESAYVPALILRSEFDVAHVSLALLTREELLVLHRYAHVAEHHFRELLQRVLRQIAAGEYKLPKDGGAELDQKKKKILAQLDGLTRQYA